MIGETAELERLREFLEGLAALELVILVAMSSLPRFCWPIRWWGENPSGEENPSLEPLIRLISRKE